MNRQASKKNKGDREAAEQQKQNLRMYALFLTTGVACVMYIYHLYHLGSSSFINLQHPVTLKTLGLPAAYREVTWFRVGMLDMCTIGCYTLTMILITSLLEDLVRLYQPSVEEVPTAELMPYSATRITFHVMSLAFSLYIGLHIPTSWSTIWHGYPESAMPSLLKLYYLCQISFFLQCLPDLIMHQFQREDTLAMAYETVICGTLISIAYLFSCPLAMFFLLCMHHFSHFTYRFAEMFSFSTDFDDFLYFCVTIHHAVSMIEKVSGTVFTFLMFLFAETTDKKLIPFFLFGAYLISVFITLLGERIGYSPHPAGFASNQFGFPVGPRIGAPVGGNKRRK